MREKILEVIKKNGSFNGNYMGGDTYVVWVEELTDKLLELFEGTTTDNRCVCCGVVIPEGRQVCPNCEKELYD